MTSRAALALFTALVGGLLAVLPLRLAAQEEADFATRCASWVAKKGYSRDYIYQRIGSLPPARAKWVSNIRPEELQVGDVVMLTLWPGHVGLVDEIARDANGGIERLKVSSFNYGRGQGWLDRSCDVTVKFGIEVNMWVLLSETTGYWRPRSSRK